MKYLAQKYLAPAVLLIAIFGVYGLVDPQPALAGTPQDICSELKVVFFDLGDTLLEVDSGSGLLVLRAGAAETVAALQARNIRLGIITNVPSDWTIEDLEAAMATPEFLDEFEVVILSSEAPAPKPDPAIFLYSQAQLSNPPATYRAAFVTETLGHIANSENNPTVGARAVGMVGIHLSDGAPSPLTDYTLASNDLMGVVTVVESHGGPLFCDGFESGTLDAW